MWSKPYTTWSGGLWRGGWPWRRCVSNTNLSHFIADSQCLPSCHWLGVTQQRPIHQLPLVSLLPPFLRSVSGPHTHEPARTQTHTHTYTYTYVHTHACTHTCTHARTHVYTCTHTYMGKHTVFCRAFCLRGRRFILSDSEACSTAIAGLSIPLTKSYNCNEYKSGCWNLSLNIFTPWIGCSILN